MQERKVNKSTFVGLIEPEMDEQEHIKASAGGCLYLYALWGSVYLK